MPRREGKRASKHTPLLTHKNTASPSQFPDEPARQRSSTQPPATPDQQQAEAPTEFPLPPPMVEGFVSASSHIPVGTQIAVSIRDLNELRRQGLLTDEEFAQAKYQVLHEPSTSPSSTSHTRRRSRSSDSSSSSSHSSSTGSTSGSSSKRFMISQRQGLWGTLDSAVGAQSPSESVPGVTPVARDDDRQFSSVLHVGDEKDSLVATHRGSSDGISSKKELRKSVSSSDVAAAPNKYGTFHEAQRKAVSSVKNRLGPRLYSDRDVVVKYFNSRGKVGESFAAVQLTSADLRSPIIQHRGGVSHSYDAGCDECSSRSKKSIEMTSEEKRLWEQLSHKSHSSSSSSVVELNLNWHFVEVIGRDEHNNRRAYNAVLSQLTKEFGLCPAFFVNRDHTLVLPQVVENPDYPRQYLICLRVATEKISTTDDSILELTNRWLIVVDLNKKLVICIHRIDCESMANLRIHWNTVMQANDIAFEEFLLKLLDDAVATFSVSLDAHASLLDMCEAKLLQTHNTAPSANGNKMGSPFSNPHSEFNRELSQRVFSHFDQASQSAFLDQLLDYRRVKIDKSEMNSFLYHLHRRSSVQHRVLLITQGVLSRCFTKLRLCSKQHATQMCSYCTELAAKAQEIRDDSQHLLDMHISLQSFRTNELMAVLTRLSVLFTPCAFFAGVYGMNFQLIPELHLLYGYYYFWALCLVVAGSIQYYFYRRGLF